MATNDIKQATTAKPKGVTWFTVHLPGHAVWETQATSQADAKEKFRDHHHINETDRDYMVYVGQCRGDILDAIRDRKPIPQTAGA
jgi:hypothetical protein